MIACRVMGAPSTNCEIEHGARSHNRAGNVSRVAERGENWCVAPKQRGRGQQLAFSFSGHAVLLSLHRLGRERGSDFLETRVAAGRAPNRIKLEQAIGRYERKLAHFSRSSQAREHRARQPQHRARRVAWRGARPGPTHDKRKPRDATFGLTSGAGNSLGRILFRVRRFGEFLEAGVVPQRIPHRVQLEPLDRHPVTRRYREQLVDHL